MLKEQLSKRLSDNPFCNLNEAVYDLLYQNIISLTIDPGASLSETAISKELDISRTPIRNALLRLQTDGLVVQGKGQSLCVASISKEACQQLMEARLAIEGQAAYWAAERASVEDVAALKKNLLLYKKAHESWNIKAMVEYDHAFHQMIIDASQNKVLVELYNEISPRVLHYRNFLFNQADVDVLRPIMGNSTRHHESLTNAIQLGFCSAAKECIERDISGMLDIVSNW